MFKKSLTLIVLQRRMVDAYRTFRLFRPTFMDPIYANRFLRDARYWMQEIVKYKQERLQ